MSTDFITNICSALEQTSSTNNVKRQEAEGYIQQVSLSFLFKILISHHTILSIKNAQSWFNFEKIDYLPSY